ncbi:barstar family protein [Pararobbsia alpina]|uniref:Barstar (barnase inhibitor) domain-containing protein n=1 Tax=Pararobbsia alpina TaxID=621374 RepID=A0A6S7CH97_9BURK|nr:barstar family protein [Pararobbsia alpina]CAB3789736.1 hypothetical protein LMG28138_02872 [Pararobbsia alpina]
MDTSRAFTFVPDVGEFSADDALVARVGGEIQTPRQLFELLYQLLTLPGYFGFNWDALFDCLRDFHWVSQRKVVIVHEDFPALPPPEMKIYLEMLGDAVMDWKGEEPHCLEAVFDEDDRARVEALMTGG